MPFAHSGGVRLYYEVHGEGPAVVLVNGLMMTARGWMPQTQALAQYYRCICYDLRGQLLSDKPDHDYTFAEHAEDLAHVLDAAGERQVHLVGVSYGGVVATAFAARFPERVRSLALLATVAEADDAHRARFQRWIDILDAEPRSMFAATVHQNYSPEYIARNADELARTEAWFVRRDADYYLGLRRLSPSIRDVNQAESLASIECPTLVIAADGDTLLGDSTAAMAARIPHARLQRIASGHAVNVEQPAAVSAALIDFLTTSEAAWSTSSSNPRTSGAAS